MMDKHIFIRKYWGEEGITYYIHFLNNYAVRQIEVTGNRILRFSVDEHDFLCDQPLDILEDIGKQDIISEQEFELIWNDTNLKKGVSFISQGDIFAIENVKSFAHGCNCAGAMGRGIALEFKQKFPEMYQQYRHLCLAGKFKPGYVFDYKYTEGHIYNLGTQETWRTNAKIEYITEALNKMLISAEKDHVSTIAMPAIGAGLGGLDWKDVRAVINDCARYHPTVFLYVVESYKKGTPCIL